mgnify:CR=1 FL=1
MNAYTDHGYDNRKDYLLALADDFGIAPLTVFTLADLLGPDEDFDGLVTSLEDYAEEY